MLFKGLGVAALQFFSVGVTLALPSGTNGVRSLVRRGGATINDCTVPGTIALTYDDGPEDWTADLLDILDKNGVPVTFFVTGNNNNKGAIDVTQKWIDVIKRAYASGHQIASHTWDHLDLSTLDEADRRRQMTTLETALQGIIGVKPAYMRPPYSSCTGGCPATMASLGYDIVYFDLDTDDYNNDTPALIQNAKNNFANKVSPSNPATDNWLAIEHDIHEQTVHSLTQYMIDTGKSKGYKFVTLSQCLGGTAPYQ